MSVADGRAMGGSPFAMHAEWSYAGLNMVQDVLHANRASVLSSFAELWQPAAGCGQPDDNFSWRLCHLVHELRNRFQFGTLGLIQVWTSCLGDRWPGLRQQHLSQVVLHTHRQAFSVDNAHLQSLRQQSCEKGITGAGLGMLGKVWSSGALQVVQNVAIIPQSVHPRNKMDGECTREVSELVYIPIYDQTRPANDVAAVIEVVISAAASEAMIVANVISACSNTMADLQLSLSKSDPRQEILVAPATPPAPALALAPTTPPQGPSPPNWQGASPLPPPLKPLPPIAAPQRVPSPGLQRTTSIRRLDSLQDTNIFERMDLGAHPCASAAVTPPLARPAPVARPTHGL